MTQVWDQSEELHNIAVKQSGPRAFVNLNAFDENISIIDSFVKEPRTIRIATKSIRVPELLRRILFRSTCAKGLMTFCARESEYLAFQGFDDLLLAYPTLQKVDLFALRRIHESQKTIRVVVDSVESLDALSQMLENYDYIKGKPFEVIAELDCSFDCGVFELGVKRSPLKSVQSVVDFAKFIRKEYPRLKFAGVMAYESIVAGVADQNPFYKMRNFLLRPLRTIALKKVQSKRHQLVEALGREKFDNLLINGGGTGDVNWVAGESSLSEITAGSGYLCGHLFNYYSNLKLNNALSIALPIVRKPNSKTFTTLGGGYVASGSPGWDRLPVPSIANLKYDKNEGAGEVQTPFRITGSGVQKEIGDYIFVRPAKSGEIAERFSTYSLIQNMKFIESVKTYRGDGQCYF